MSKNSLNLIIIAVVLLLLVALGVWVQNNGYLMRPVNNTVVTNTTTSPTTSTIPSTSTTTDSDTDDQDNASDEDDNNTETADDNDTTTAPDTDDDDSNTTAEEPTGGATLIGDAVCLPKANPGEMQTMECAYGIHVDGLYYGVNLDFIGASGMMNFQTGSTYKITGNITPYTSLRSDDPMRNYNIRGVIAVTKVEKI